MSRVLVSCPTAKPVTPVAAIAALPVIKKRRLFIFTSLTTDELASSSAIYPKLVQKLIFVPEGKFAVSAMALPNGAHSVTRSDLEFPLTRRDDAPMSAYQYVYHMDKLSKTYPGAAKPVFDGISLHFLPDAKIGVVGVNGAGKSTLLKIMATQEK